MDSGPSRSSPFRIEELESAIREATRKFLSSISEHGYWGPDRVRQPPLTIVSGDEGRRYQCEGRIQGSCHVQAVKPIGKALQLFVSRTLLT